ncbi:unnamed protein product [Thlaspi arvense]|uniref:Uncharacterized protein n=1 Tax=Thlaspi arvense TaxID=13288 RepID=A0AAU9ST80_THLAR|nr:unnamed protein product [Thlaspi arvense]
MELNKTLKWGPEVTQQQNTKVCVTEITHDSYEEKKILLEEISETLRKQALMLKTEPCATLF